MQFEISFLPRKPMWLSRLSRSFCYLCYFLSWCWQTLSTFSKHAFFSGLRPARRQGFNEAPSLPLLCNRSLIPYTIEPQNGRYRHDQVECALGKFIASGMVTIGNCVQWHHALHTSSACIAGVNLSETRFQLGALMFDAR